MKLWKKPLHSLFPKIRRFLNNTDLRLSETVYKTIYGELDKAAVTEEISATRDKIELNSRAGACSRRFFALHGTDESVPYGINI